MFELNTLDYAYDTTVNSAYVIKLEGNEISEGMTAKCIESCKAVGQPLTIFKAVDGTSGKIMVPDEHKGGQALAMLRLSNETLTPTEVACFLSHYLLWVKCIELEKPIVILEHDAVMVRPYLEHPLFNAIMFLGSKEQTELDWQWGYPMPPHAQLSPNFRFMLRAHAYAIDPMVAKNLVGNTIRDGITTSADVIMRADRYSIIQDGFYAYDDWGETTITERDDKSNDQERINTKIQCL